MEDRELLELAAKTAKAAGIEVKFMPPWGGGTACFGDGYYWNQLTNDADALRLAVAMCLPLDITDVVTEIHLLGIFDKHGSDS